MKKKIKLVNVSKLTHFEPAKIATPNSDHELYKKYGIKHYKETRPDLSDEGLNALAQLNKDKAGENS